jgi:hypothetical protein
MSMVETLILTGCIGVIIVILASLFHFGSSPGVETFDERETENPFESGYEHDD